MKKITFLAMICAAGMLVSCASKPEVPEEPQEETFASMAEVIEKYTEACEAGDMPRAMEIAEHFKGADLSSEESRQVIKASNTGAKVAGDAFKKVANSMPYNYWDRVLDQYEAYITQYAGLIRQKAAGKKVKDQMKALDKKLDEMEDQLDDAKLTKAQEKRFDNLTDWYDDIK